MNKFIYLIILLILVGGGFYLWQNRHDYFFQGTEPYEVYNEDSKDDEQYNNDNEDENDNTDNENNQNENEDVENVDESGNQDLLDILQNHCNNRCEDKKDTSDYDYCLEICGFNTTSENQSSDCGEISEIFKKDVCYKNKAIKEKNAGICEDISDDRLKENCKDRVIEELFN